jgi:hypothetical protein
MNENNARALFSRLFASPISGEFMFAPFPRFHPSRKTRRKQQIEHNVAVWGRETVLNRCICVLRATENLRAQPKRRELAPSKNLTVYSRSHKHAQAQKHTHRSSNSGEERPREQGQNIARERGRAKSSASRSGQRQPGQTSFRSPLASFAIAWLLEGE